MVIYLPFYPLRTFFNSPSKHRGLAEITAELVNQCHYWDSISLANTVWPALVTPETLPHPTYELTQVAFPYEWWVLAHASQLPQFYQTSKSCLQWAPGQALAAAHLESQIAFARVSPSPAQVAAISDCFIAHAGCCGQNTGGSWLWPIPPRKPQGQHAQCAAVDHVGAPPPCAVTADLPWRAEVGSQWSQPVLAADWPG